MCGALRDLVPFLQFKKREKHPWRSVNFSKAVGFKPATLLKLTLLHGCFLSFLNCTNGTKSCNAPHVMWRISDMGVMCVNVSIKFFDHLEESLESRHH